MTAESLDIPSIARALNAGSYTRDIGTLQDIRARVRGYGRRPSSNIFTSQTIYDGWAFHYGGRTELQFNIGVEEGEDGEELRHGVAFSFQLSQSLPSIDVLVPKVRRFNDYMRAHSEDYADLRLWHHRDGERSGDADAGPIPSELVLPGTFVFLGRQVPASRVDLEAILDDFDRLLPLYRYVEGDEAGGSAVQRAAAGFQFRAGCSVRPAATTASLAERQLNVTLRHNLLQQALTRRLIAEFGRENVADEHPTGRGTLIDVVVRHGTNAFSLYEIKTALSAAACIREALGQVLEYAYWPGCQEPKRIVICGEGRLEKDAKAYLRRLKEKFGLPLEYEQIVLDDQASVP